MTSIENNNNSSEIFLQSLLTVVAAAGTVLIIGWLLKFCAYGIDLTDEGFYLVWIANPFLYDWSITQFGFVYHPLYMMLGGNIAVLRQANILITFGLAWSLVYFFMTSLTACYKEQQITLLTVSAGLATSSFIFFDYWLPTPSYNSLTFQALLVCAIGLILTENGSRRMSTVGWVLIGIGGGLVFLAKPSTAFALVISVLMYLLLARKLSIQMLALTLACALALLLVSALLIDGSVLSFIKRLQLGVDFSKLLGSGHTMSQILRIDSFQLNNESKIANLLVSGALFFALCSKFAKNKKWSYVGLFMSVAFFSITALLALGQIHRTAGLGQFQGLLIFSLVFAVVCAVLIIDGLKTLITISLQQWALAALFLAMPHIYAFGTSNNYWQTGSSAAIFWLLAGLVLLGPLIRDRASWMLALPIALAAQAVTATLVQSGLEQPYRQSQPLRLNTTTLSIGSQGSDLMLSSAYAEYIASAKSAARDAAFETATPMIDLSGHSPGILYAIGAESIGQAWTIGGYPGSSKLAETALAFTSCEKISAAWILFEHDGPRRIPTDIMISLGADFPVDFEEVGKFQTAEGVGGYRDRRTQKLFRPVQPHKTLMTCLKLRNATRR